MNRRDFLTLWLQALLLSFFPWLRSERGIEVAGRVAESMVPKVERAIFKGGTWRMSIMLKGWEIPEGHIEHIERTMRALTGRPEMKT